MNADRHEHVSFLRNQISPFTCKDKQERTFSTLYVAALPLTVDRNNIPVKYELSGI